MLKFVGPSHSRYGRLGMRTDHISRGIFDKAAEHAVSSARQALVGCIIDPQNAPAVLIVTRKMGNFPDPHHHMYTDDPESYIRAVVSAVDATLLGKHDDGWGQTPLPLVPIIRDRASTIDEMASLRISSLIQAGRWDLRVALQLLHVGKGFARSFGAVSVTYIDLDGDTHYFNVACAGWDPDANRYAALCFKQSLDLMLVLERRQFVSLPAVDNDTFMLWDEPEGGWRHHTE